MFNIGSPSPMRVMSYKASKGGLCHGWHPDGIKLKTMPQDSYTPLVYEGNCPVQHVQSQKNECESDDDD